MKCALCVTANMTVSWVLLVVMVMWIFVSMDMWIFVTMGMRIFVTVGM